MSLPPQPRGRTTDGGGAAERRCPRPLQRHPPSSQWAPPTPGGQRQVPVTGSQVPPFRQLQEELQFFPKVSGGQAAGVTGKHEVTGHKRTLGPEAPPGTARQLPGQKQLPRAANRTLGLPPLVIAHGGGGAGKGSPRAPTAQAERGRGHPPPELHTSSFPTSPFNGRTVRGTTAEATPPGPSLLWGHGAGEPFSNGLQPPMCRAAWGHHAPTRGMARLAHPPAPPPQTPLVVLAGPRLTSVTGRRQASQHL